MRSNRRSTVFLGFLVSFALIAGSVVFAFGENGSAAPRVPLSAGENVSAAPRVPPSDEEIIRDITTKPAENAAYDGYLVRIEDGALGALDRRAMDRTAEEVIGDRIAVVDKPEDVLKFANADDIEIIEPNYRLTTFAFPVDDPADPLYHDARNCQWGVKYVNAKAAWQAGYRGEGVNIAIVDTGIVHGHEDLNNDKILSEYDWVNKDGDATDDGEHGSMVGGIIAADIDNRELGDPTKGVGMAGIIDKAGLTIQKVLSGEGKGNVSDIMSAYNDILNDGNVVDVVNLSLGHEGYIKSEDEMVQQLIGKGIIVIAATGNSGTGRGGALDAINYPAGYDNVIGVGSIGMDGQISYFSTKNKSADIVAPGEMMTGLAYNTKNGYDIEGIGTSFAAPVVAAAAGIVKQRDKKIDANAFLTALKLTSRDAGAPGYDTSYGYGILDIGALVNYLQTHALTVTFNANGGKTSAKPRTVWPGGKYGKLPVPTRKGYGFSGWYTKAKGGVKITDLSVVGNAAVTLYAHWQGGTTLSNLKVSAGKLSPAFSFGKTSYKLTLSKKQGSVKISAVKSYKSAKLKIKTGSGKYRTKNSVTVKLKKGKQTTVYVKLTCKNVKTKTYKIKVKRKK
jgi:uncharacterized repeat protein (TIGR02543 family)